MNEDMKIYLYKIYYQEIYDYVKEKVKNPERAVDVTQKIFAEIFESPGVPEDSEKFIKLAKSIADKKSKFPVWKIHIREEVIVFILILAIAIPILLESSPVGTIEKQLKSWEEWETGQWDEMFWPAFFTVSKLHEGSVIMDKSDALATFKHTGIGDVSLIENAAMSWIESDKVCYVAMIQAHNEDEVGQIISLMKTNMNPEEWFVFDTGDSMNRTNQERWGKVSVDDFGFYVNGDCILITYIDPELVESGEVISVEEMRERFDMVMTIRSKKLEG